MTKWAYSIAVYREDWAPVGRVRVDPDWEPAIEWLRLLALNDGRTLTAGRPPDVHPLWSRQTARVMTGFEVVADTDGDHCVSCDFPIRYFRREAGEAAGYFVEAGRLAKGAAYRYLAVAEEVPACDAGQPTAAFTMRDVMPPTPGSEAMRPLVERALVIGEAAPREAPAFIAPGVLDEIVTLTRRAAPNETGGALVGHVRHDPGARQVFTRVEAQLCARHTLASSSHLEFTSDTWDQLRRDIEARGRDEVMVGWWHSHPVREWCRKNRCAALSHGECALARGVFSEQDQAVQRTVFPSAHSVALVANDVAADAVRFSAYGWSLGMVHARSVFVLRAGTR